MSCHHLVRYLQHRSFHSSSSHIPAYTNFMGEDMSCDPHMQQLQVFLGETFPTFPTNPSCDHTPLTRHTTLSCDHISAYEMISDPKCCKFLIYTIQYKYFLALRIIINPPFHIFLYYSKHHHLHNEYLLLNSNLQHPRSFLHSYLD